jgi:prophage tail gpP-like protein
MTGNVPSTTLDPVDVTAQAPTTPTPTPAASSAPSQAPLPSSEDVTIVVNGQTLLGWTGVRIVRGIERLPSGLVLQFSERYPGQAGVTAVNPGNTIQAYLGSDLVLTGYVNLYNPKEDAASHIVRAEARSKTQDLVDCSLAPPVALPPWVFHAATIGAAATQICQYFGISVTGNGASAPLDPKVPFVIQPGETPAELLEYMARTCQVLMYDDPQGRLVFANVGTTRAGSPLVEGINCEVSEARLSDDQRYSQITVIGQAPVYDATGPHLNAESTAPHGVDSFASAQNRYRPKLVVIDMPSPDNKWANQRADWEVARRYGRSRIVDVTVTGWRDGAGTLWTPNTIVNCQLPSMKINQDLLIAEVAWMRGEQGTSSILTLMPQEGFMPQPFHFVGPIVGYVPQGQ